ncbi:aspartate/glutamate racemase family protein, partial [Lutimonas sp.]|uniref:aspartate/glutamate racemase family protein n=1 Tax=Lutimonas sp. TaxID=1872403 RepID=UPI003C743B76
MKKIGLIGGMSWESTLLYYELINKKVKAILGGLHSANCVIESVDFSEIAELQAKDDWKALDELMINRARSLEGAGAELLMICANTMHLCVEAIGQATTIPIVHIAEVTADQIKEAQLEKVALLGTKFTMERDFFKNILMDKGIEVIVPGQKDRDLVHEIIYKELVRGEITLASKKIYLEIIDDLKEKGAQGIILGCTEIPLLIGPEDTD